MQLPFKLEEGIYLESDNLILKWWTDRNQLSKIGNPLIICPDDGVCYFTWRNRKILDNTEWHVSVDFDQRNPNGILERVYFTKPEFKNGEESKELYTEYSAMFRNCLGEPRDYSIYQRAGEPMDVWHCSGIKIHVGLNADWGDFVLNFGVEKLWPNNN